MQTGPQELARKGIVECFRSFQADESRQNEAHCNWSLIYNIKWIEKRVLDQVGLYLTLFTNRFKFYPEGSGEPLTRF